MKGQEVKITLNLYTKTDINLYNNILFDLSENLICYIIHM